MLTEILASAFIFGDAPVDAVHRETVI